jgi:hypothetical protein
MNPALIENSAKQYIFNKLQSCHTHRTNVYYYVMNIGIFIVFGLVVSIVLYFCYTNKLSDTEKHQNMIRNQQYILSKIQFYQTENNAKKQNELSAITDLPFIKVNH